MINVKQSFVNRKKMRNKYEVMCRVVLENEGVIKNVNNFFRLIQSPGHNAIHIQWIVTLPIVNASGCLSTLSSKLE